MMKNSLGTGTFAILLFILTLMIYISTFLFFALAGRSECIDAGYTDAMINQNFDISCIKYDIKKVKLERLKYA